ncbi:M48 family metalloprotease [Actinoallomurus iriomotensis]|uniref:Peptidase M48 domain-containing protein n=1 Tax=Actinoallomurus iriomotensis TaxID=478107 RepID=A0A9W6S5U8_9ACTN|nr:M48 family metalloprotease [Actinoallomurus iriomotensis]GLY87736.1 hypothetical protein Airi02_056650 [Actinoallomurus iriomotensis]
MTGQPPARWYPDPQRYGGGVSATREEATLLPKDRLPGVLALVALIPGLAGALTIVAPVAYGLDLLWPTWGAVAPFAAWAVGAAGATWQRETILRRAYGYREPSLDELRRLKDPVRRALARAGVSAGQVRLMIVKSREPTAPATTGRLVAATSYAVDSLPPDRLEAVLTHELSHRTGLNPVPVFCYHQLVLPVRALWWLLAHAWRPVRRMWRVAVAWRTPFGFLVTFLLALVAAVVIAVLAVPACVAFLGAALSRISVDQAEFQADATVTTLGLGPQLLAALEDAIDAGHTDTARADRLLGLPPLAVRRAQRLRRKLARRTHPRAVQVL